MSDIAAPIRRESGIIDPGEALSPAEKKVRTVTSFTRKVELLEAWAETGPPAGQWWPRTPTELRQWHQPGLDPGVRAWSSPNVASEAGQYGDLRRRFDNAAARLAFKRKETPRTELEAERGARVRAEKKVAALAAQNTSLIDRLRYIENDFEVVKAARDAAQRRVREYEEMFGRIVPKPMAVPGKP